VGELAAAGIPVAVTCRVLNIARQPYYRWLAHRVTDAEMTQAYRANALIDAHRDDPEFGYRFLADEARTAGQPMADRTAWRICSGNGWFSAFGKRKPRGKGRKVGPPVHDDLVRRDFTAAGPNRLWLADITEHHTGEGKLYLCAIKDVWSNRIVGYSIDSRMKSRLAVTALHNAAARRGDLAGCVLHTDRGCNFDQESSSGHSTSTGCSDRWAAWAPPATTPPRSRSSACCRTTSLTDEHGPPANSYGSRS
jgi:transposase InsO family protein